MKNSSTLAVSMEYCGSSVFDMPNETGTPERNLCLAVLERAILDFVGNDTAEIAEAEEWIFDEQGAATGVPFSFDWVCGQLDLDSKDIREKIKAMPKRGAKKIAPWYFSKHNTQPQLRAA